VAVEGDEEVVINAGRGRGVLRAGRLRGGNGSGYEAMRDEPAGVRHSPAREIGGGGGGGHEPVVTESYRVDSS
jgi:hypothetical protein